MQSVSGVPNSNASALAEPIRVMVVDDSAVVRGLMTRMLEEDSQVTVVASVGNGQMAVNALERQDIEVAILDIEMPVMDGLTALPLLLKVDPHLQVIMASTLTVKNAEISLRALENGAADYIPKPTSSREISGGIDFKTHLIEKVLALAMVRRRNPRRLAKNEISRVPQTRWPPAATPTSAHAPQSARPTPPLAAARSVNGAPARPSIYHRQTQPIVLRQAGHEPPDIIAIGSSTGGPQALFSVLSALPVGSLRQPILITQHMPPTFTTILAEHITRVSGWQAAEAKDGEAVLPNRIYVAPGDFHMTVEVRGAEKIIRLNKNPPENFCRPSVDPMLRSLTAAYGRRILVVILTGMGSDGLKGGQVVVDAGGTVIAQDEASSVVWGMPGAVATAGLCSAVLPIGEISQHVIRMATRH
jgi:two-component system chemotaxis response regulator CheB